MLAEVRTNEHGRLRGLLLGLLFVLGCTALSALGVWQLTRAETKRERFDQYQSRLEQAPIAVDDIVAADTSRFVWRRATLSGRYLDRHILLDNRIHRGRAGYEVLSFFRSDGGRVLLVNRGWVAPARTRDNAPQVLAPADSLMLDGTLGELPVVGLAFNEQARTAEWMTPQIVRVQRIDLAALAGLFDQALWPAVLYLKAGSPGSFEIDWPPPGDGSARHTAYAVQWFAMATVLAGIGLFNWHRVRRAKS